jgi:hypothetical protein
MVSDMVPAPRESVPRRSSPPSLIGLAAVFCFRPPIELLEQCLCHEADSGLLYCTIKNNRNISSPCQPKSPKPGTRWEGRKCSTSSGCGRMWRAVSPLARRCQGFPLDASNSVHESPEGLLMLPGNMFAM